MTPEILYTTADLELVKKKLSGIITRDIKAVGEMIRKDHADEIRPLQAAFADAGTMLDSRQWAGPILAQVSVDSWVERADGEMHVKPSSDASLRFLALQPLPEDATGERDVVAFKERFAKLLLQKMPRSARQKYLSMLRWVPHSEAADEGVRGQPLSSEIAFGHNLDFLEKHMGKCAYELEQAWSQKNAWPSNTSLPSTVVQEMSKTALTNVQAMLDGWFADDAKESAKIPNNLIALTMVNLAANRALLEYSGLDARGSEAESMVIEFLRELNLKGLDEVPIEMDGLTSQNRLDRLWTTLNGWFGPQGKAISSSGYFSRAMAKSELDLVIFWSQKVQQSYIAGRGNRGDLAEAWAIHGSACHLFIFALAIVASFYGKTKVPNEFTGKKNPMHSIFPSRNMIASGEAASPSTHALKLLEQAYGLMYFGNTDWYLRAGGVEEKIAERAAINSTRRLHLQQLIFSAVKNRSSSQLLVLHRRLDQMQNGQINPI